MISLGRSLIFLHPALQISTSVYCMNSWKKGKKVLLCKINSSSYSEFLGVIISWLILYNKLKSVPSFQWKAVDFPLKRGFHSWSVFVLVMNYTLCPDVKGKLSESVNTQRQSCVFKEQLWLLLIETFWFPGSLSSPSWNFRLPFVGSVNLLFMLVSDRNVCRLRTTLKTVRALTGGGGSATVSSYFCEEGKTTDCFSSCISCH